MPSKMKGSRGGHSKGEGSSSNTSMSRAQRNQAEKQRRDKLNSFINELANIVPMVSKASKKLDKTSILRLSAAHLRIYQSMIQDKKKNIKPAFKWRPNDMNSEQLWGMLEGVEGFLLVLTHLGKIVFISHTVNRYLGHQQIEVLGHSIYSFIHPLDCDSVKQQLETLTVQVQATRKSSSRCSFYCRIRERSQPKSEVVTYQLSHIVGHLSPTSRKLYVNAHSTTGGRLKKVPKDILLLKSFVKLVHSNPYNELSLTDSMEDEYTTRHSLDGTIMFADHRLSTITGHLPHEVTQFSAYKYILPEDIPLALFAHKQMFTNSNGTGMIVYRLRTQNNSRVYLKSMGYLQYDRATDKVDHFLCINKLLTDEEGEKELKKFHDRFTPHITNASLSALFESIKSVKSLGLESILMSFQTKPKTHSNKNNGHHKKSSTVTSASAAATKEDKIPPKKSVAPKPSREEKNLNHTSMPPPPPPLQKSALPRPLPSEMFSNTSQLPRPLPSEIFSNASQLPRPLPSEMFSNASQVPITNNIVSPPTIFNPIFNEPPLPSLNSFIGIISDYPSTSSTSVQPQMDMYTGVPTSLPLLENSFQTTDSSFLFDPSLFNISSSMDQSHIDDLTASLMDFNDPSQETFYTYTEQQHSNDLISQTTEGACGGALPPISTLGDWSGNLVPPFNDPSMPMTFSEENWSMPTFQEQPLGPYDALLTETLIMDNVDALYGTNYNDPHFSDLDFMTPANSFDDIFNGSSSYPS